MQESLDPIQKEPGMEVDVDEIAKQVAENLREKFKEMKEANADPHMKYIEPSKLTYEDLMIFGKSLDNKLLIDEFKEYSNKIQGIFGKEFISNQRTQMEDLRKSRAMGKISDDEFEKKFREILNSYDTERAGDGNNQYEAEGKLNSRATFKAMIRHWLTDEGINNF